VLSRAFTWVRIYGSERLRDAAKSGVFQPTRE
jgi:hypothetical protein